MRVSRLVAPSVVLMLLAGAVHADPKGNVSTKIKAAMEAYDSFDYDGAKKALNDALALAKKSKLDHDPVTAKAYVDLGIVAFAVPDQAAAKEAFVEAVKIDPKIQIDVAYKSPELAKLLEQARAEAGKGGGAGNAPIGGDDLNLGGGGDDCGSVHGLDHTIIDSAKAGAPQPIEVKLGPDVKAAKVSVMFRPEHATDFTEVKLSKAGDCKYTGAIPASAMKGSLVHYYVAAYGGDGTKPLATKGSAGSPNIIEISGVATAGKGGGDDEDPIGGGHKTAPTPTSTDDGVSKDVQIQPKGPQKVFLGLTGGSGGGYVTGTTEGQNTVKSCCIGKALVIATAELGYYVNPQLSIGIAFRMGFPLDANYVGHATGAPAGLLRVRYALSSSGDGFHVMGQAGAGFLRNTIKVDVSDSMMGDTDVVAQGPLLVGGGIGYTKRLTQTVAFIADLDALAGLAVVSTIGNSPMNSGISADANIGFTFGF
ncbi:MAG: tetratricopeptide repeat protein [Kofleriaceae bacterium]